MVIFVWFPANRMVLSNALCFVFFVVFPVSVRDLIFLGLFHIL